MIVIVNGINVVVYFSLNDSFVFVLVYAGWRVFVFVILAKCHQVVVVPYQYLHSNTKKGLKCIETMQTSTLISEMRGP